MDEIEAWLTDHTDLDPLQRQNVRRAVLRGQPVPQESLRPTARDLAIVMLAGQVRPRSVASHYYWLVPVSGGLLLAIALAAILAIRPLPSYAVVWALDGSLVLILGLAWPRWLHRRLEQAVSRNQHDAAA